MLCHTMYKPLQHFHCDAPITRVGVMYSTWSTLRLGANPLKFRVNLIARYIQAVALCRSNRCSLVGTGVPPQVEKDTTPSGPIFKPELLNNEESTQHKTVLFRKALARRDDSNAAFGTLILSAVVFSGVEDFLGPGGFTHTPSGPIFKPELLNNEEGTQHKTVLFRKALARRDDSNAAFGTLILSAVVFSGVEDFLGPGGCYISRNLLLYQAQQDKFISHP